MNFPVVLLTDHGEALGHNAASGHGLIWNEQVHSAWLLRTPEELAQQCSGEIVLAPSEPDVCKRLRLEFTQHLQKLATRAAALGVAEEVELDQATLKAPRDFCYSGTEEH